MAYSWQEETYASGTTDISVDIEYLDKSYIYVYLDDELTTAYTWSSDVLIALDTALTASTVVTLVRRTDKEELYIKFADGAAFIRDNIDTQNTQFLHLAQEMVEGRSIDGFYGDLSMNGFRITNLGTPTDDSDAATKAYVDGEVSDEYAARVAADASLQSQITGLTPVLSAERSIVSWHGQTIDNSVTIPDSVNAFSIGPQITIQPGQEVTVGEGSYWSILGNVFESDELYNVTANNLTTEDGNTTVAVAEIVVDSDIGTIASQDSDAVAITGGSISGITDLAVADGGTGASTAEGARTNLGAAASGANSDITGLSGLTTALSVAQGGTGAITAAAARASLGAAASAGVTDASNASAGTLGEVITVTGAATSVTSGTIIDLASIALTAGDWDITGAVRCDPSEAITGLMGSLNTAATTQNTFPYAAQVNATFGSGLVQQIALPTVRINVSAATTVYANAIVNISSGTATARAYIYARRIR